MQEGIVENRIGWIDVARGILIILVIIGHAIAETSYKTTFYRGYVLLFRCITIFHMPAFYIISGMLFNSEKWRNRSFGAYLKRKTVSLLVPYFVFEGCTIILQVYLLKIMNIKEAIINP
jgi:fucose 4-O-acetylase-like acetyltransferase